MIRFLLHSLCGVMFSTITSWLYSVVESILKHVVLESIRQGDIRLQANPAGAM